MGMGGGSAAIFPHSLTRSLARSSATLLCDYSCITTATSGVQWGSRSILLDSTWFPNLRDPLPVILGPPPASTHNMNLKMSGFQNKRLPEHSQIHHYHVAEHVDHPLAPGIQVKPKAPGADPQSREAKPKSKQQDGDDRADRVRRSTRDHSLSADDSEYDTRGHVTKRRRASNSPPPTRSDRDMWNAQFYPPIPSYYHPAFFPQPGQYHIIHMVSHQGRHCFRLGRL